MANPEHFRILKCGVSIWNQWRADNTGIRPNLRMADLSGANLGGANLHEADLYEANLHRANLQGAHLRRANLGEAILSGAHIDGVHLDGANLTGALLVGAHLQGAHLPGAHLMWARLPGAHLHGAHLHGANLHGAHLHEADLRRADLGGADLHEANLSKADLSGADLTAANLERASLVSTRCDKAIFTGCRIHGLSAWDLQLADTQQTNLIITPRGEPDITVDNLEVAQFIYLLRYNKRVREVIDTIASKVVLIIGRFTPERKKVLDAIRDKLRNRDYLPVLFDFNKRANRDTTETVSVLAHMARFVIADLTDTRSLPQELMAMVPNLPSVAVQPLLLASEGEYGMFDHFKRNPCVLETVLYQDQETLLRSLESTVIIPAEQRAQELITSQRK